MGLESMTWTFMRFRRCRCLVSQYVKLLAGFQGCYSYNEGFLCSISFKHVWLHAFNRQSCQATSFWHSVYCHKGTNMDTGASLSCHISNLTVYMLQICTVDYEKCWSSDDAVMINGSVSMPFMQFFAHRKRLRMLWRAMDSGRLGGMFFKGEWAFCVFKTTHARCDKNHRHFIEQDIMMDETFCCTEFAS